MSYRRLEDLSDLELVDIMNNLSEYNWYTRNTYKTYAEAVDCIIKDINDDFCCMIGETIICYDRAHMEKRIYIAMQSPIVMDASVKLFQSYGLI